MPWGRWSRCIGVPRSSLRLRSVRSNWVCDLWRVAPVSERSSSRTSGPCQDFSLPPELRCWFILPSPSRMRQCSPARVQAQTMMLSAALSCLLPRSRALSCCDDSPRCLMGAAHRAGPPGRGGVDPVRSGRIGRDGFVHRDRRLGRRPARRGAGPALRPTRQRWSTGPPGPGPAPRGKSASRPGRRPPRTAPPR